jgi:hypothetical protein
VHRYRSTSCTLLQLGHSPSSCFDTCACRKAFKENQMSSVLSYFAGSFTTF